MERILRNKLINGTFGNVTTMRSRMMKAVKGKGNKSTEIKFCHALTNEGIEGWELHTRIIGNPDIYFPMYRVAIFLDGCFWHGCPECGHIPKTNNVYWKAKIERNVERDLQKSEALKEEGYTVIRFWEHELNNLTTCIVIVKDTLEEVLDRMLCD